MAGRAGVAAQGLNPKARLGRLAPRGFNRAMALLLALSVAWMLAGAF